MHPIFICTTFSIWIAYCAQGSCFLHHHHIKFYRTSVIWKQKKWSQIRIKIIQRSCLRINKYNISPPHASFHRRHFLRHRSSYFFFVQRTCTNHVWTCFRAKRFRVREYYYLYTYSNALFILNDNGHDLCVASFYLFIDRFFKPEIWSFY